MLPELCGFAIPSPDLELDFLMDNDACDPDDGPPQSWPAWTDDWRWELGPGDPAAEVLEDIRYTAMCADDDKRPNYRAMLKAAADTLEAALASARNNPPGPEIEPPGPELETCEPDEEDLADYLERQEYEHGCNARFV
jgi:hypothetical protein